MRSRQRNLGSKGAEQGAEHVPLSVPGVPLGAEEIVRGAAADHGGGPFEEFVAGAQGEADAGDQEEEPAAAPHDVAAQQDLPRQDRRDEPLGEVAETIVGVPRQPEEIAEPEPKRNLWVSVVTADHQDQRMQEEE